MKLPSPSAMLVEHPAVPVPMVDGGTRENAVDGTRSRSTHCRGPTATTWRCS